MLLPRSLSALLPRGAASGAVRSMGFRTRWWQPVLPAMANLVVPDLPGKHGSTAHKKAQQRKQQAIADAARRKEGARRNRVLRALKKEKLREKTFDVYRQYADILRAKALSAPPAASAADDGHDADRPDRPPPSS